MQAIFCFFLHASSTAALPNLNYLIQTLAYISEGFIRQSLDWMRPCATYTPVERFWLVTKHITGLHGPTSSFGLPDCNGKWVVGIICSCSHGQTDDKRCLVVEVARRNHQKRVHIPHFLSCLGIAIDPDNILPVRDPQVWFCSLASLYHRSAPAD